MDKMSPNRVWVGKQQPPLVLLLRKVDMAERQTSQKVRKTPGRSRVMVQDLALELDTMSCSVYFVAGCRCLMGRREQF